MSTLDESFYTMPDGREETAWMRPHRELVDSLPIDDQQKRRLHDALDAVYDTAIEIRAADHVSERQLLRALMRQLPASRSEAS